MLDIREIRRARLFLFLILFALQLWSCASQDITIKKKIYHNSTIAEGFVVEEGDHVIYQYVEKIKKPEGSSFQNKIIKIEILDPAILKKGNELHLPEDFSKIRVYYTRNSKYQNISNYDYIGSIKILEVGKNRLDAEVKLVCSGKYDYCSLLNIDMLMKW